MKDLINDALICVNREQKFMDKMLSCEEKGDNCRFVALREYYKILKEKTDSIISKLITNYGIEKVVGEVMSNTSFNGNREKIINTLSLIELVNIKYINSVGEVVFNTDAGSFAEENNKFLYSMYLFHLDNMNIPEISKTYLHDYVKTQLSSSQFIRSYYSGEVEEALRISNPDACYGKMIANDMAFQAYYTFLNKIISDANSHEVNVGRGKFENYLARKKMLELELATICTQMQNRDIYYSNLEVPISNYTKEILKNASLMSDQFNDKEKHKKYEKIIYL